MICPWHRVEMEEARFGKRSRDTVLRCPACLHMDRETLRRLKGQPQAKDRPAHRRRQHPLPRILVPFWFALALMVAPQALAATALASIDDGKPTRKDGARHVGKLASGRPFDARAVSVAHRTLPDGTCVELSRGALTVVAVVDDVGPCGTPKCAREWPELLKREFDLKPRTAAAIGCSVERGLCRVTWRVVPCAR